MFKDILVNDLTLISETTDFTKKQYKLMELLYNIFSNKEKEFIPVIVYEDKRVNDEITILLINIQQDDQTMNVFYNFQKAKKNNEELFKLINRIII
jgi:hypothetical protein